MEESTYYSQLVRDVLKDPHSDEIVITGYSLPVFDFTQFLIHLKLIEHGNQDIAIRIQTPYKVFRTVRFKDLKIHGNFIMKHLEILGDLIFEDVTISGMMILKDVTIHGKMIMRNTRVSDSISATNLKVKNSLGKDKTCALRLSEVSLGNSCDKSEGNIYLFPGLEVEGDIIFESVTGVNSIGMMGAKIFGSLEIRDTDISEVLNLEFAQITRQKFDLWEIGERHSPVAKPILSISKLKIKAINLWAERGSPSMEIEGWDPNVPTIKFEDATIDYFYMANRRVIGDIYFNKCVFNDYLYFVNVRALGNVMFKDCKIKLGDKPRCDGVTLSELSHTFDIECTKRMVFQNTQFDNPRIEKEFIHLARHTLERNGYDSEADEYFLREKRIERYIKRIERECRWKSLVEQLISAFMDNTIFKTDNIWLQSVFVGVFSTIIPVFLVFMILLTLSLFIPKLLEFFEWSIADFSCNYGTNWKRPIWIWIFGVIVVFPSLYWFMGSISWFDAIYQSALVAVTLGLGKLEGIVSYWVNLIVIAEAIFGTFMWAVFLTVFARKFMRR